MLRGAVCPSEKLKSWEEPLGGPGGVRGLRVERQGVLRGAVRKREAGEGQRVDPEM